MSTLVEVAKSLDLARCAELLERAHLPPAAPPDETLAAAPSTDAASAIDQARRRGLAPDIVAILLEWFTGRPVELGLFSWDVLNGALLDASQSALITRLRENAKPVKKVLPQPGSNFTWTGKQKTGALVEQLAAPPYQSMSLDELHESVTKRSLGAMDALLRQSSVEMLREAGFLESTRKFARLLHLGRMSTLASFYLDYLWTVMAYRPALDDLAEVLLDVGAPSISLPRLDQISAHPTDEDRELSDYIIERVAIMERDIKGRLAYMSEDVSIGTVDPVLHPRTVLSFAEIGLEEDTLPVGIDVVGEIVKRNPDWRYAERVWLSMLAGVAPKDSQQPIVGLAHFLSRFGNNFGAWYSMARYAPSGASWLQQMDALLAREATQLPHDYMAWSSLAERISNGSEEPLAEVNRRLADQARIV